MASYVNKKSRVFKQVGEEELKRRRSDGRMKTYQSETDARAWCGIKEDRRQHILELIRQGDGKNNSLKKIIPIEAIVDILMLDKNADIKRLQEEIDECRNNEGDVETAVAGIDGGKPGTKAGALDGAPKGPTDREGVGTKFGQGLDSRMDNSNGTSYDSFQAGIGFNGTELDDIDYDPFQSGRVGRASEGQLGMLQGALAEKDLHNQNLRGIAEAAIEQLENIKDIVDDKDPGFNGNHFRDATSPKNKLPSISMESKAPVYAKFHRTSSFSPPLSSGNESDACKAEIDALENEIKNMKVSSKPEADIVKKEVEVLKKYCAQLSAIQEENQELKKERDLLREGLHSSEDPGKTMRDKLRMLEEVTDERDEMRARVQQLEDELTNYNDLPQEIDKFRKKSQMLENMQEDRDDLQKRLDNMVGLEDEVRELKRIADKCAEFDDEMMGRNREIDNLTCKCENDEIEKDMMREKMKQMEKEIENLRNKSKELEALKIERDCFKCCLNEMGDLQQDYENLLKKTQNYDYLQAECVMYKAKYEKLKNLEDECNQLRIRVEEAEHLENERDVLLKEINDYECCIKGQESEIKRLACHIDCLSQNLEKREPEEHYDSGRGKSKFHSPNRKTGECGRELHKQKQYIPEVEILQTTNELFKRELELERRKNNELTNKFANQSKTIDSMIFEIDMVRKENTNDKKILSHLNITLKTLEENLDKERNVVKRLNNTLEERSVVSGEESADRCTCTNKSYVRKEQLKGSGIIPHFHAEVTRTERNNKHKCVMNKCPCLYSRRPSNGVK